MQETQEMPVQPLGREDTLEEGMATHSSILAWRISRTEEPGGLQSMGSHWVDTTEAMQHIHMNFKLDAWYKEGVETKVCQLISTLLVVGNKQEIDKR